MGPIRCPETSVNNYQTKPRNTPEEHSSHQHRGGRLKLRRERESLLMTFVIIVPATCRFVFCLLNTGVVGLNPTRGLEVCWLLFCVRVFACRYGFPDVPILRSKSPIHKTFRNVGKDGLAYVAVERRSIRVRSSLSWDVARRRLADVWRRFGTSMSIKEGLLDP
jgi:hypothetical protein